MRPRWRDRQCNRNLRARRSPAPNNNQLEDSSMTLRLKRREEERQFADLIDAIYNLEAGIRQASTRDGVYRGDLVHAALNQTMTRALEVGISIGAGRVHYHAVPLAQTGVAEKGATNADHYASQNAA
jgi:hypothetical protein